MASDDEQNRAPCPKYTANRSRAILATRFANAIVPAVSRIIPLSHRIEVSADGELVDRPP